MHHQSSRIAKWSLVVGIVIVLNMFFNYAISLVYPSPQYDRYVMQPQVIPSIATQADCIAVGGQWTEAPIAPSPDLSQPKSAGYCDPDYTNRRAYEDARRSYERTVFIVLVILGVLSLTIGTMLSHVVLTPALAWGGVLSLVIASMRYWGEAGNALKVSILAVALGALVWVALKKFEK